MSKEKEMIMASHYAEFPDVLVTLELCRALAVKEGRKVGQSLRDCAAVVQRRVSNQALKNTCITMSKSRFPEVEITRIRACIGKMEASLRREFRDVAGVCQ